MKFCSLTFADVIFPAMGPEKEIFILVYTNEILYDIEHLSKVSLQGPLLLTWYNFNPSMDK